MEEWNLFLVVEWVFEPEVRGGVVREPHGCHVFLDLFERLGEPFGIASQKNAGGIGQGFTAARDGETYQGGRYRRKYGQRQSDYHKPGSGAARVAAAPPAPEHGTHKYV